MVSSWVIQPSVQNGNNRRIELSGLDLLIAPRIDNVFVYPAELDIERFKDALSRTLSIWPLVAGHFLKLDNDHYFIEMSDHGIPLTYIENIDLEKWSVNENIVIDLIQNPLLPFIDGVQTMKLMQNPPLEESLVRLQLTRIVQSNEWVLGTSWAHILGDAASNLRFLQTLSNFYQQLEPPTPLPIFERHLWKEDEVDQTILPLLTELYYAKSSQEMFKSFFSNDETSEQINLHFSGKQLTRLRELVSINNVTIQDVLTSYIILLLNTYCFENINDEHRILRAVTGINFRGVSDSIAPIELISNAVLFMSSEDFDNPLSLSNIAQTIRQSINRTRHPEFLERCVATADRTLRKLLQKKFMHNLGPFPNTVTVNSNLRYDWAALVDFGYTDKCRFYTLWTGQLYFRVFRLNPIKNGHEWLPRDHDGAEVAFRISKTVKEKFINALEKDIQENFSNIKLKN